jgi:hypothetical protein
MDGHLETHSIRSRAFKHWLTKSYLDRIGKAPNSESLGAALNTLEAVALYSSESRKVFIRIAGVDGKLFLDLCNSTWQVVEISSSGWRVMESADAPVRFRRARGMLALPLPEVGGSIDDLRQFLNVRDDSDFKLNIAWLTSCFRDRGPYPILALYGERGTAKSSSARALRRLVDPNILDLRGEQKDLRDLMIAANGNWVMGFDNLSHLPAWLSDAFCRLSTGGGFGTRALYENDEEILIDAERPILLTGIEEIIVRGDAADRALMQSLTVIKARQTEKKFWASFYRARPQLLGALLDTVAGALRYIDSIELENPPRMADFATWGVAVEKALNWDAGSFLAAYADNRESANETTLEASAIGPALQELTLPFGGTASDLLSMLNSLVDEKKQRERSWPKSPRALSGAMRRIAPSLRAIGIDVEFDRDPGSRKRTRHIIIRRGS